MIIIGAGLAGLLAANILRKYNPTVIEAASSLPNNHSAVLRHRDSKISEATSIPFKKVRVTKAISHTDGVVNYSTIEMQNKYSKKVIGEYTNRSISNVDPVTRYIAPNNFIGQLAVGCNIRYLGKKLDIKDILSIAKNDTVISTIPMPAMWSFLWPHDVPEFKFKNIIVATAIIDKPCDVYQTIYYPESDDLFYRVSITGNLVMGEAIGPVSDAEYDEADIEGILSFILRDNFGIDTTISDFKIKRSKYGKIKEIDDSNRKEFIHELSSKHNVYSLGRFATWRNILLDDVLNDVHVIQKMIEGNGYFTGAMK